MMWKMKSLSECQQKNVKAYFSICNYYKEL